MPIYRIEESESHRHGTIRHRPPPDVHGHDDPLLGNAISTGFPYLLPHYAGVHSGDRQAHQ